MNPSILVGTSKGLVIFSEISRNFQITEVHFEGLPISMVYIDERTDTWWVSLAHRHWGEKLHYSTDKGKRWNAAGLPSYAGIDYKPGSPASLKKIWIMQHAGKDKPNCLWLGTEPGGLFYSEDNGIHFSLNEGLWNHPSRLDDKQWFGTGKDFPFIHSIIVDPRDSRHLYVGVSCAGVFESSDGGQSWHPKNRGLIASYLPNARVEIGHDPHRILLCESDPKVIWQQNHCGIFRTVNGGVDWKLVSREDQSPSYGFALAIDQTDSNQAWVIPAASDESRIPPNLALSVYHTINGGVNWNPTNQGLPRQFAFDLVLRHAFIKADEILAFGTNNGNVYASTNNGQIWRELASNLAPVCNIAVSLH